MSLSKLKQFVKKFQFEDVSDESDFYKCDYIDGTLSVTWPHSGRDWKVSLKKCGRDRLKLTIEVSESEEDSEKHIEFQYALFLTHRSWLKCETIEISGRAVINEKSNPSFRRYHNISIFHKLRGLSIKDMYMKFGFDIIVFYDNNKIRNLYLGYQHDMPELPTVTVNGKEIGLPMRALKRRTPLFAKALEANEVNENMKNYLEVFIQVILGVQVQLEEEEIEPLLKMATEYEVLNVKKYCEQHLLWRDDLQCTKTRKFRLACKHNLNHLMKELLKFVKTKEQLRDLEWELRVSGYRYVFKIEVSRMFRRHYQCEFLYQLRVINKYHLKRERILRNVGTVTYSWYITTPYKLHDVSYEPSYNQYNFQLIGYAFIDEDGLRELNFEDEDIYGKSITVLTSGGSLKVPIQFLTLRAPLLAKYIDKKKPDPKLDSCLEEFFQVFHGVHVQLEVEEIKSLLKISAKFQVVNVKRYCEQQLIRKEDLEVSEKRKFKLACKYNLNILMNEVLKNVKTVEQLAKYASIAIDIESMDTNISKLLIAKMYKFS